MGFIPDLNAFKPVGIPMKELEMVNVTHEELEAMRLVDLKGLDQMTASSKMGISRRSFATDLKNGRRKVLEALTDGKAIKIQGGDFTYEKDLEDAEEYE